ncbi:endonuclease/exonuclease/phosphatase family protein [Polaribacter cellanae]|uniref:Endonuclease/exonuclease/phosphatase family protein n=1 Tax=Polaribacter cellanae TaxID=2818493 RepID=A0A975CMH5_9FLAO|nr:endonuclease/exonuclease/phosphatase family protein [Polaribacter cellanae]QTE21940.1 endonuclease/exonuclease/phosphatase family protein [Polaribacter cellanae]
MRKVLKYLFRVLLLLITALLVFFFWASSATLNEKEYSKLILNTYDEVVANDSIFSIVTYNIGYLSGMTNNLPIFKPKELFDKNLEKVLAETKKLNPDILAFQEIDYNSKRSYFVNQQNEIAKLGYNYVAQAINWDKNYVPFPYWPTKMHFGKIVSGQSILSKYPLKEHKRIVLEKVLSAAFYRKALYLERLAQVVKVTLNKQEVILINVHLEAFDKQTRVNQFEEVLELFNNYKEEYPTILLGDFNSLARDKKGIIKKMFLQKGVGNAAFNKENIENTYDSKNAFERIDYIFYTKNTIEYISGKVLIEFGESSDHLPVEMKFKLK